MGPSQYTGGVVVTLRASNSVYVFCRLPKFIKDAAIALRLAGLVPDLIALSCKHGQTSQDAGQAAVSRSQAQVRQCMRNCYIFTF